MKEIVIHGRGGLGAVTTGQILSAAAFYDKKFSHSFPTYGVERTGAPVQAFVRINEKPINIRCEIYNPDIVIVLEPSLIEAVDITKGLKKDSIIIVNTNKEMKIKNTKKHGFFGNRKSEDSPVFKTYSVDATGIAMQIFGKPIVNTVMLGAFAKVTGIVSIESIKKAIDDVLGKKGKDMAELNKRAVDIAYKQCKGGVCKLHI